MSASVNLTESQITTVLGDFLSGIVLSGTTVIVGQANLVPEPVGSDFVVMWPLMRRPMAYNIDTWDTTNSNPAVISSETDSKVTFQLDVHGPQSSDNAQIIVTLWRDDYASVFFDNEGYPIRPLYIDDARQMPFLNESQQIETKWAIEGALQGNFTISTPQQFADTLVVGLIDVDVVYPPEA